MFNDIIFNINKKDKQIMNKRIWELDFLRGFAIIMMVFDHLMYDLMYLPNFFGNFNTIDNPTFDYLQELGYKYWISDLRFYGHFSFVALFLLVSGISYTFSKNNLSRGLKLLGVALLITLVTLILDNIIGGTLIVFGIIHLYAVSILIIYLLRKFIKSEIILLIISLIIIFAGFPLKFYDVDYLGSFSFKNLPEIIIGLKGFGADYFSIIPYTGVILLGTVLGNNLYLNRVSLIPKVKISDKNIINIAGRKSLLIFVTHQVILIALVYLIGYLFGYRI